MRTYSQIQVNATSLAVDVWNEAREGPPVVLLHAGVCDRRSWYATAERLGECGRVIAYDRRGFGDTPPPAAPCRHVDDLFALLDGLVVDEPVWLVGSSAGGRLALEAALLRPERVRGLVLITPAISGAPEPDAVDPDTQALSDRLDAANAAGDLDEVNRLEAWLWLDGPAGPEGRVGGRARELARTMNAIALSNEDPERPGHADVVAWERADELRLPVTMACGELDIAFLIEQCALFAARLPRVRQRPLPGMAHLPFLEQPAVVADLIRDAIGGH